MKVLKLVFLFTTFFLLSCDKEADRQFIIGFSQCTGGDAWRKAMQEEMKRELSFYPNYQLVIKDAQNNSQKQVEQIQELLQDGVDLLIVSPNEAEPITSVVEKAFESGVPVIVVDRKTRSSLYTSYIGADNFEIGKLAGEYVAQLLNGRGNIVEVWGLQGSSPAIERHNGFIDAIKQYEGLKIIEDVQGEWERDIAKREFPKINVHLDSIDLLFAHNDVMALGVYEYLKSVNNQHDIKFIGIDGLGGPNGGLQFIEDGILDATFLYPTGGEETINLAHKILRNEPYKKENLLNSTVIDGRNVHIMKQQMDKILNQQRSIERQQEKIAVQMEIYRNQRVLLYILLGSLAVIIFLGALALLSLREKHEINKALVLKNNKIIKQRNEISIMAQKADEATEAKFKFFTNISHEFRTPLTLILGPIEDMLKQQASAGFKQDLQLVQKNAMRLLRLVNQLMDFRKIENQKMNLQASERDIISFIKDIADSFKKLSLSHRIDFSVKTDLEELNVYFDTDKLDKVLFNLLSNAFKYTRDGGYIHINVELSNNFDEVIIIVEDDGEGMSDEHLEHAFDRFYTGKAYDYPGTGLGLALSKEFIELHKGAIKVVSEKWKGTRFIISLPLGKAHLAEEEIITGSGEMMKGLAPEMIEIVDEPSELALYDQVHKEYTLLIIEDNLELSAFLSKHLSRDFNVVVSPSGDTGLNKAFEIIPDLIICDVMLPVKDGLEVTTTLKGDLRTSHIPIIQLTAKDSTESQIAGIKSGADLYIIKPFSYQHLYERILNLIKNREILRDHYNNEIISESTAPKQLDKRFISEFKAVVQKNITNPDFNVNQIASYMGMSRVQVYRKVKALMGYSVNDYVVKVKLKKAKHLILNSDLNISEIAYQVGFSSPAYFSTAFKNHYRVSPKDYKASKKMEITTV